jgi:hypothetical protein
MYYFYLILAAGCFASGQNLGGACWLVAAVGSLANSWISDEEDELN